MKTNQKAKELLYELFNSALKSSSLKELFQFNFIAKTGDYDINDNKHPIIEIDGVNLAMIQTYSNQNYSRRLIIRLIKLLPLCTIKDKLIKHIYYLDNKELSEDETTSFTRDYKLLFYNLKIQPQKESKNLKMVMKRLLVNTSFLLNNEENRYLLPVFHKYYPDFISKTLPKEKLTRMSIDIQKCLLPYYL